MGSAATKRTVRSRASSATSHCNSNHTPIQASNTYKPQEQDRQPSVLKTSESSDRSAKTQSFSITSEEAMVCESCSANFTIFKRKSRCIDCSKLFCSNCIHKEPRKCCKICHMFSCSKDRNQLMQFKVKDLRQYLAARDISTITCREKEDLVDLVVQYLSTQNGSAFMITVDSMDDESNPSSASHHSVAASRTDLPPTVASSDSTPNETGVNVPVEVETARNTSAGGSSAAESNDIDTGVAWSSTIPPKHIQKTQGRQRTSISDLTKIDDISFLSVRQLKEILTLNFINYKGCVERWELEERVTRLYNEKQALMNKDGKTLASKDSDASRTATSPADEANMCKICMDAPIECVLLECGHMITCTKCGKQLAECPLCRQYIVRAVHVFRS